MRQNLLNSHIKREKTRGNIAFNHFALRLCVCVCDGDGVRWCTISCVCVYVSIVHCATHPITIKNPFPFKYLTWLDMTSLFTYKNASPFVCTTICVRHCSQYVHQIQLCENSPTSPNVVVCMQWMYLMGAPAHLNFCCVYYLWVVVWCVRKIKSPNAVGISTSSFLIHSYLSGAQCLFRFCYGGQPIGRAQDGVPK